MSIRIEFEGQGLSRAEKLMAGIEGGVDRAVKSAMTRAVSHLRTSTTREIRKRYDISAPNIRANENVRVSYHYGDGVVATVRFAGHKIPLFRYGGAAPTKPSVNGSVWTNTMIGGFWKRVHPSLAAKGHQLKGTSPYHFDDAFVAQMQSGHIGIFERTGGASASGGDAIREIMGSSVPQMLGNQEVQEELATAAKGKFEERLDHEVNRILNGWGT